MKFLSGFILFFFLFSGVFSHAQVLEIEHSKILVDTVPFKFSGSVASKNYTRYREIRIGCLNTGKKDLIISGASQSFTNDTSWLNVADNIKYPNQIKAGTYGTIVITYSAGSPFERIKITSNSKKGDEIITLIDTYKDPLEIKRNMSDYPAKLKEGEVAVFSSLIYNKGSKKIIIDSVAFPDSSLKIKTKLPITIGAGKNVPLSLTANTKGKMNFYYGGTPLFFYHEDKGFENFAKQEFSCIIVPFIQPLDQDTFNAGNIKRGTIISQTFHFINKGSFVLETGKNKSECITYDKLSVAPGESFAVTIKFNTTLIDSGKFKKEFPVLLPPFFYSNSIFITGIVSGHTPTKSDLLQSEGRMIECPTVSNDTAKSIKQKIMIRNNSGFPINITNVTVSEGAFAFSDAKTTIPAGGSFNIKFVYPTKMPGMFDKLITISYSTGDCTNGEFTYQLEIKGTIISK
ncbi:hypothetical protein BH09BAC5_BH09BAC5_16920 [soil metagenome]